MLNADKIKEVVRAFEEIEWIITYAWECRDFKDEMRDVINAKLPPIATLSKWRWTLYGMHLLLPDSKAMKVYHVVEKIDSVIEEANK